MRNFAPSSQARVVKLVDTLSSGGSASRCAGSSPVPGTKKGFWIISEAFFGYSPYSPYSSRIKHKSPSLLVKTISSLLVKIVFYNNKFLYCETVSRY